jgi:hypothetical protein
MRVSAFGVQKPESIRYFTVISDEPTDGQRLAIGTTREYPVG